MERIGKVIDTAFLGTDQQGHLTTLRKENRTCACGAEFIAHIKVVDGEDVLDGLTICGDCRAKADAAERREKRLAQIPEAERDQQGVWEEQSNLPAKFANKTFGDFDRKLQPQAYDAVKKYNHNWDGDDPPHSLILLSPDLYGVGKTHLVAALLNKIIETDSKLFVNPDGSFRRKPCPVYFTVENTLLSRIRQTYNHKQGDDTETEEDIYKRLERYALLVIDDVGKVRPRDYSFLQGVYFRIIDDRYSNDMPIILTTNLSFTELENHIGGASADRLREMCGDTNFIVMKGKSYRQKVE